VVARATLFVSAAAVTPLVVPWSVVVEVPVVEPIVMFVVEPAAPFVPMFTVLVEPEMVAPVPTLIVPAAVELPSVWLALEKVMLPETVWVLPRLMYCWVPALMRANRPEVVVQMSPLTGVVGAAPCGRLRPAPPAAEATVLTLPVNVLPASGA
jgi:hypothetical protein